MKRYFFYLQAPAGLSRDEVGVLLPDETVLLTEAVKAVRYILIALPEKGATDWIGWAINVVSEEGRTTLSLAFDKVALANDLSRARS